MENQAAIAFEAIVKKQSAEFLGLKPSSVVLMHHNDTDGLSSGYILLSAFQRLGVNIKRYCLEKPYPEVVARIFAESTPTTVFVICDFGSGMLPTFSSLNNGRNEIFVVDHHAISLVEDPKIHLVNPLLCGINGGKESSASVVCYLFANALSTQNKDLSAIAVLGALGDRQIDTNGLLGGLNLSVFEEAKILGLAQYTSVYELKIGGKHRALELTSQVDALGSLGYFSGGVEFCLEKFKSGIDAQFSTQANELLEDFKKRREALFQKPNEFLHHEKHIQWFDLGEQCRDFGVKTVGLLCEWVREQSFCSPDKYILGFQRVRELIPTLGDAAHPAIKVSMRVPEALKKSVEVGERPALTQILPAATRTVGGFVDACHPLAAATTIPLGKERELIRVIEELL